MGIPCICWKTLPAKLLNVRFKKNKFQSKEGYINEFTVLLKKIQADTPILSCNAPKFELETRQYGLDHTRDSAAHTATICPYLLHSLTMMRTEVFSCIMKPMQKLSFKDIWTGLLEIVLIPLVSSLIFPEHKTWHDHSVLIKQKLGNKFLAP